MPGNPKLSVPGARCSSDPKKTTPADIASIPHRSVAANAPIRAASASNSCAAMSAASPKPQTRGVGSVPDLSPCSTNREERRIVRQNDAGQCRGTGTLASGRELPVPSGVASTPPTSARPRWTPSPTAWVIWWGPRHPGSVSAFNGPPVCPSSPCTGWCFCPSANKKPLSATTPFAATKRSRTDERKRTRRRAVASNHRRVRCMD